MWRVVHGRGPYLVEVDLKGSEGTRLEERKGEDSVCALELGRSGLTNHCDSERPFPWFLPDAALPQGVCSTRQAAAGTCKIPWDVLSAQNNARVGMDDFLSCLTSTTPIPPSLLR